MLLTMVHPPRYVSPVKHRLFWPLELACPHGAEAPKECFVLAPFERRRMDDGGHEGRRRVARSCGVALAVGDHLLL